MDSIRGAVTHIVYRNEENGYTIFSLECGEEEITCTGTVPELAEGEYLRVCGQFVSHPVYGRQLRVSTLTAEPPEDTMAMERYLGSGAVKGIGPKLAARIVLKFGADTFRIMEEEPERLAEIKGITERKAAEFYKQFHDRQEMRDAMMYLGELGISLNLSYKIYRRYGKKLYQILSSNPYQLVQDLDGVGFSLADEIAQRAGISPGSPQRISAGILYVLQKAGRNGHTCLPSTLLTAEASQMLGVPVDAVDTQLSALWIDGRIVRRKEDELDRVSLAVYDHMEVETAAMLLRLNTQSRLSEKTAPSLETGTIRLTPDQHLAVQKAAECGILVLTGGPGTGKTTTINAIIRCFEELGQAVVLAAPTGRAARRMSQASGREAKTIHRLLEVSGPPEESRGSGSPVYFERNEQNPLDADVVIIDEMSMIDLFLMHALLKAVAPGTHLVLVGDHDQLPSVGPGRVLGDILDSGLFPVVNLDRIFRQALESDIVKNAHLINDGKEIALDNKSRDFFCIRRDDVQSILGVVVALVRDKLPPYVGTGSPEIQVLTPMRKGELGVERLNEVLQQYLNPPRPELKEVQLYQNLFREGDKIMQVRNNYQIEWEVPGKYNIPIRKGSGIFNGDMGVIEQINHFAREILVRFDENRVVRYSFEEMEEVDLAYAVTVHKSQGSEYPAVVLPLLNGPRMLMNRNILYTAVTRAKKCVVIVGSARQVGQMIASEKSQERYSGLADRIREIGREKGSGYESLRK